MTHSRSLSHGRPRSTIHSTRHSGTSSPYLPHQRFRFLSGISSSPRSRSIFPTIATCLSYRDRSRIACSPPVLPSVSSMSLSPGRSRVVVRAGAVSGSLRHPLRLSPIDRGRRCRHRFFRPVRLRGRSMVSFARSCATLRRGGRLPRRLCRHPRRLRRHPPHLRRRPESLALVDNPPARPPASRHKRILPPAGGGRKPVVPERSRTGHHNLRHRRVPICRNRC